MYGRRVLRTITSYYTNAKILLLLFFSKIVQFRNGSNKVAIELRVVQFLSEIILVISNPTRATRMILDQIALHSVQLPLFIQ